VWCVCVCVLHHIQLLTPHTHTLARTHTCRPANYGSNLSKNMKTNAEVFLIVTHLRRKLSQENFAMLLPLEEEERKTREVCGVLCRCCG
jgi:hypothetical protein